MPRARFQEKDSPGIPVLVLLLIMLFDLSVQFIRRI
jgi:hypothetical protein